MSQKKLDIVLFGVTGLVGRYGLRNLYEITTKNNLTISWGVAGRNVQKIRHLLQQLYSQTNDEKILHTPVFSADMIDPQSIDEMVKSTKILLNFCGPLRKLGEVVIRSCIKFKTHYLDLSAEPNFIEMTQMKYDNQAMESNVYIVNSCGYDSLAYEMGIIYLKKHLSTLNSVETYLRYGADRHGIPGPDFNTATWNSVVDLLGNSWELKELRKKNTEKWPVLKPALQHRMVPFHPEHEEGWAVLSPSADLSVMRRTQRYMYKEKNLRPIQIESYFIFKNVFHIFFFIITGSILLILSKCEWGKNLLLKHPSLFSGGVFGDAEPSEEKLEDNWCSLTLVGKGWKNIEDQGVLDPDTKIVARIKGYNTGYNLTSLCLVLSGVLLHTESDMLPNRKGVLTPGPMFSETTMIEKLHGNGLKFELIKEEDIRKKCTMKNKL